MALPAVAFHIIFFQRWSADRTGNGDDHALHGKKVRGSRAREALRRLSQTESLTRQCIHATNTGQLTVIIYLLRYISCQCLGSESAGSACFGPPGSETTISQRYGSGSFPFLIKVLSGPKQCLRNKTFTQNFCKHLIFITEERSRIRSWIRIR